MSPNPSQPPSLRVEEWEAGPVVVLALSGALVRATAHTLEQPLVRALARRVPPLVVVDAERLSAVDPVGGDLLAHAVRYATQAGGRLVVAGGGERVEAHVADAMSPTLDEALSELARPTRRGDPP
ncbi:STAS domain-containing protein [Nonomuraea sp. SMC257]|uniref:STAS domain-containing protein n=1 Tax=Nonomuraea montanisoli TaxID=2741721 RepID=A0A7Y6I916_9ACTN|nr:STAS domain-containing protein [Nonomuraea montanisoli]NUW33928.1 STAS domain-containing protein [Nonomuraea montanisoli]